MKAKTYQILKNLNQPACIVLGLSSLTGLSIVRSLSSKRVPVIGVDRYRYTLGTFSKYCSTSEIYHADRDILSFLKEAARISRCKNVIICESDFYLLFIDKYRADLQKYYHY